MKIPLWIVLAAALATACALYLPHASKNRLNVAPDAQREIEKAKQR